MKLPKYNREKEEKAQEFAGKFPDIPLVAFLLYPYFYKNTIHLPSKRISVGSWENAESADEYVLGGWNAEFRFMSNDSLRHELTKGKDMEREYPTELEFEAFCLVNNISYKEGEFLTQERIKEEIFSVLRGMKMKDMIESIL